MADCNEFEIGLSEGGTDSAYRMSNSPSNQEQRPHLVYRAYSSERTVKGTLNQVVHGKLSPGGEDATLIVATFNFLGQTVARRFKLARIEWDFSYERVPGVTEDANAQPPEVIKVSLDGQYVLNESTFSVNRGSNVDVGIQGGTLVTGSLGAGWTQTQAMDVKDHISIFGTPTFNDDRQFGEPTGAKWVLEENESQKSGIPGHITTAILLRRQSGRPFLGTIEVKVQVGLKDTMYDWFGRKPRDDPVRFNPSLLSTGALYDSSNLDKVKLDDVQSVVYNTSLSGSK